VGWLYVVFLVTFNKGNITKNTHLKSYTLFVIKLSLDVI
jgi:hypothetical protein